MKKLTVEFSIDFKNELKLIYILNILEEYLNDISFDCGDFSSLYIEVTNNGS